MEQLGPHKQQNILRIHPLICILQIQGVFQYLPISIDRELVQKDGLISQLAQQGIEQVYVLLLVWTQLFHAVSMRYIVLRDAMSEKYPVYQEDVFSSFTASQSIPVSTSISNMVPTPLTDSNTPSSSINQLPQSTYASSTQQTVGKTGGKDQMNFPNQNSYTPNLLLNVGQNQNSTFKPLDLPAVAVCKFGIDLLHLFVENNDKMACKPIWQKMIASLKAATRRIELPVPVRKQAHAVLVTAKQTEFIQLVFAKPNTKAGGISITSSSSSGK
ncbi:MAG: hypothetical protein EZS28_028757 [Streblomastix strix]|uniref:Uncharacterized protein n=1 Tax=Streblomastix strix TaxID=222440 RepID=A0A5J4V109_9EUKA|nr:MAG: hypothetical protein EZS28_028757 [Streblomastix strix]